MQRLNPYCCGICPKSDAERSVSNNRKPVSILIVVEYALKDNFKQTILVYEKSLNPYCCGICPKSSNDMNNKEFFYRVSILIVVEYALKDSK